MKEIIRFDGNAGHVELGLRLCRISVTVRESAILCVERLLPTRRLYDSNNFATSSALAEVCTLLSAI